MQRARRATTLSTIGLLWLAVGPAWSTTIVPVANEDLAASSDAVVAAAVTTIDHAELADGRLVTRVTLNVTETWKGTPPSPFVLIEPGGIVGDRGEIVYGAPKYQIGEPVVVFASRTRFGWRTNHMLQGKFRVIGNGPAAAAVRHIDDTVAVIASSHPWRSAISLRELRAAVEGSPAAAPSRVQLPDELHFVSVSEFNTQSDNPRFFEADTGESLVFLIDDRGDDIIGFDRSRRAIQNAFAAWNAIDGTSLQLIDGGLTDDISVTPVEGIHKVLFNDPGDEIPDPTNCAGTLGIGGSQFTPSENKTFNGAEFNRILSAKVTLADNWDGCDEWVECNVSEVVGHEVGHAFGLGHSSENPNEGNGTLRQALMYFRAHFDDRCADTREDDVAGIRFIYPAEAPPAITTSSLPVAIMGEPFRAELEAVNIAGTPIWTDLGQGCPPVADVTGLTLSPTGVLEGTIPNLQGDFIESCFTIGVTDDTGDSHAKRVSINYVRPTPTPTSSPTPTPTAPLMNTPTRRTPPTIPPDRPCVGDCNENLVISINELVRGVNIALGRAPVSSCPSFDRNGNNRVSISELVASVQASLLGCTEP